MVTTERAATTHHMKPEAKWTARLLALLGVAIIVTEVVRNMFWGHLIEWWVIAIGSAFGFVGFYLIAPTKALAAFSFLRDSTVQIIGVVRSGRRSTDPIVAQTLTTPADATVAPSEPKHNG